MAVGRAFLVCIAAAFWLSACTGKTDTAVADGKSREELTKELFQELYEGSLNSWLPPNSTAAQFTIEVALKELRELHLTSRSSHDLVRAGLAELAKNDPGFRVTDGNEHITITCSGDRRHSLLNPRDNDYTQWALAVDEMISACFEEQTSSTSPSPSSIHDSFLEGMAGAFDQFTRYVTRDTVRLHERYSAGEVAAVGIGIEVVEGGAIIRSVSDLTLLGDPLLKEASVIISIDGSPVTGLSQSTVEKMLYGPAGSTSTLTIMGTGKSSAVTATVRRAPMNEPSLRSERVGNLLHVQIIGVDSRTAIHLTDALKAGAKKGQPALEGIVFDLRSNPGGLLDAGAAVADVFLAEGAIVSTRGRNQPEDRTIHARENAPTNRLPLVVLIGEHTGGAAEVVASALQDLGRAVVLGQVSSGEGHVRISTRLPNGGGLSFPVAEVVASSGYRLQERGVMPTVCSGGKLTAEEVIGALRSGRGVTDLATRKQDIDPENTTAVRAFRALCPAREDGADHVALEVAKAILADPALYERLLSPAP